MKTTARPPLARNLRIDAALRELKIRIRARYPEALFSVSQGFGDDPHEIYRRPVVDVENSDEVFDLVADRLVDLRVEAGLPINVHVARPAARTSGTRPRTASTMPTD